MKKNIFVTQPHLPCLEEFVPYLEKIWSNKVLTNGGEYHAELEDRLCDYLGVKFISLFSNGTIALITALQALRITGEVITTPYSFVATAHSLLWNGIQPVFVDIEKGGFNIDSSLIESAITPQTTAIMPVHCYGIPCNLDEIESIADNYNLKVIYDAAHAFGVRRDGESILNYGDLSVLSFHATKVFNTFEGGAIICHDEKTKKRIDNLKNFGFINETTVVAPGINGKMSEVNASFGCLQLKHIDSVIFKRKEICEYYCEKLSSVNGISFFNIPHNVTSNFSYFPILVNSNYNLSRDDLYEKMKAKNIFARRYFYPLISEFPMYQGLKSAKASNLVNASDISRRIICLPLHTEIEFSDVDRICNIISEVGS